MKKLIVLFLLLCLSGCSRPSPEDFQKLKCRMTTEDVTELLGRPKSIVRDDYKDDYWVYTLSDGKKVSVDWIYDPLQYVYGTSYWNENDVKLPGKALEYK